ncbi:HEL056Cp [Eremothecium sinecaudum]|uniref:HEL056Cp n=1 Tax=Eremothecium sinecaudum TaxID=45286 RepID=A0A0X8HTJ8_9SACH|nr:HEL056Cp [Eremothecium sinecaudum]AMD21224.1 HEL056Cp [Eremothecium sinecaudum]
MARSSKKASAKAKNNVNQEYLDLINLQKQQFEQLRCNYAQQNAQLAKSNSLLMIKITDLETKISELIQENVQLRNKLSVTELRFKERLNNCFNVLEDGAFQRFEEVLNLFVVLREQQGLQVNGTLLKQNISKRPQIGEKRSLSPKVVEFNVPTYENEVSANRCDENLELTADEVLPLKKKRRKSSRRESLFIASDFDFSNDSFENALKDFETPKPNKANRQTSNEESTSKADNGTSGVDEEDSANLRNDTEEGNTSATSTGAPATVNNNDSNQKEENLDVNNRNNEDNENRKENGSEEANENNEHNTDKNEENQQDEAANFTHSIIEYFIPEECDDEVLDTTNSSRSKLEIFHDSSNGSSTETKIINGTEPHNKLSPSQPSFVQIPVSSQSKIKHSMKPRRSNQKKIVDEVMPQNGYSDDTQRPRRTRGKAVDYKWPSLRAKMRRPTDELVDATTVTDIHELQVPSNRKLKKSRTDSDLSDGEEDIASIAQEENINKIPIALQEPEIIDKTNSPSAHNIPSNLAETNAIDKPIRKPMLLKDITNKQPAVQKTKKLLSKKVVADNVNDENSYFLEDSSINSFRLNEDDLSVFDLISDMKCSNLPKTHRAKARAERQEIKKSSAVVYNK